MTAKVPFCPTYGSGQIVTPAAAAAAVTNLAKGDQQVVVSNIGANICYVRINAEGDASTADFPLPSGKQVCLTKAPDQTRLSHISATGTSLHIITGNGWYTN
jgi:hypothetical protein